VTESGTYDRAGDISNTDISNTRSYRPTLMLRKCSNAACGGRLYPDGTEFGFYAVNPAHTCFVSLMLLYDFLSRRATSGASYKSLSEQIARYDSTAGRAPCVVVSRHQAARFFRCFENALLLPCADDLQCHLCGPPGSGTSLFIDGTRRGPRCANMDFPADLRPEQCVSTMGSPKLLHFFQSDEARLFARRVAAALKNAPAPGSDRGVWTGVFSSMIAEIRSASDSIQADLEPILPLLARFAADTRAFSESLTERTNIADLLLSCASKSPIGPAFNQPAAAVAALVAGLAAFSLSVQERVQLARFCPCLANAVLLERTIPSFLRGIAERLRDIAQKQVARIAVRGPRWLPDGVSRYVVDQATGAWLSLCIRILFYCPSPIHFHTAWCHVTLCFCRSLPGQLFPSRAAGTAFAQSAVFCGWGRGCTAGRRRGAGRRGCPSGPGSSASGACL
jgi:hypothetical protein